MAIYTLKVFNPEVSYLHSVLLREYQPSAIKYTYSINYHSSNQNKSQC